MGEFNSYFAIIIRDNTSWKVLNSHRFRVSELCVLSCNWLRIVGFVVLTLFIN